MQNQPTVRPRFRPLASQTQLETPTPQPAPPARGPLIRRASLALGRASLLPADVQPQPTTTQTQSQQQAPPTPPLLTPPPPIEPQSLTQTTAPPVPAQPQIPQLQQQPAPTINGTYTLVEPTKPMPSPSPPPSPALRLIVATRSPTPPQSPKIIKSSSPTPPQSPRIILSHPLTSLASDPEPETKTMQAPEPKGALLQKNNAKNGMKANSNGNGESHENNHNGESGLTMPEADMRAPLLKKNEKNLPLPNGRSSYTTMPTTKKGDKDMRIITIAGGNQGALMDVASPYNQHSRKHQQLHHFSGLESESGSKDGNSGEKKTLNAASKSKPMLSLVNSNVQSINNSLLFNASCAQRSPGVHIRFNSHYQH